MANTGANKTDQSFDEMRNIGEKSAQQTKQAFERVTSVAAEASSAMQDAFATSSKGYKEFSLKSVEISRSNTNAHFDFLNALLSSKSLDQAVELQTSYAREQMSVYAEQAKELTSLAQKAITEGAKPIRDASEKTMRSAKAA